MKNKAKKGAIVAAVFYLFASPSLYAAKDNSSYLNGKPFAQMSADIAANQADIEALQVSVSSLSSTLDGVISDIAALELRVDNNSSDIAALFANDALFAADLDALRVQHEQDIANINAELAIMDGRIDTLRADMEAAVAEAKSQTAALQAQHEADISDLLADITALLVQIADIRTTLDSQGARIEQLSADSQQLSTQLAGLQLRIDALSGRVDVLEGYHNPIPQQCDEGTDDHTASPWVVCEADADEAWISANNMGIYHAEEICQQLGYRTVGKWGGTCGNVCGFCQAATSCSAHGTKRLDREWDGKGNLGADEFGGRIYKTVSWSCVN